MKKSILIGAAAMFFSSVGFAQDKPSENNSKPAVTKHEVTKQGVASKKLKMRVAEQSVKTESAAKPIQKKVVLSKQQLHRSEEK